MTIGGATGTGGAEFTAVAAAIGAGTGAKVIPRSWSSYRAALANTPNKTTIVGPLTTTVAVTIPSEDAGVSRGLLNDVSGIATIKSASTC